MRRLLLLPLVTLVVFLALLLLSLIEIGGRREPRRGAPGAEEISAEALARYRKEAARLAEIRSRAREGLTARELLARLEAAEGDGELPQLERLLGDFRVVSERSPHAAEEFLWGSLSLLERALAKEEPSRDEIGLFEALLVQAVMAAGCGARLEEAREGRVLRLLERLESSAPRAALLLLLAERGTARSLAGLHGLLERCEDRQLRAEVERAIAALEGGSPHGS